MVGSGEIGRGSVGGGKVVVRRRLGPHLSSQSIHSLQYEVYFVLMSSGTVLLGTWEALLLQSEKQ